MPFFQRCSVVFFFIFFSVCCYCCCSCYCLLYWALRSIWEHHALISCLRVMFRIITFILILYFTLARSHLAINNWLPPNLNPIATMHEPCRCCVSFYCLSLSLSRTISHFIYNLVQVYLHFYLFNYFLLAHWRFCDAAPLLFIQQFCDVLHVTAVTFTRNVNYFICHFKLIWSNFYFLFQFALTCTEKFPGIDRR